MQPLQFADPPQAPLAERMRPASLDRVIGQGGRKLHGMPLYARPSKRRRL